MSAAAAPEVMDWDSDDHNMEVCTASRAALGSAEASGSCDFFHTAPRAGSGSAATGDYGRDPEVETFDGASCEAQRPLMKGHCDFCHQDFERPPSWDISTMSPDIRSHSSRNP